MGRYNFKNYEYSRKDNLNSNLDINKLSKELVNRPLNSSYRKNDSYKVGVVLYFMSGQIYKTPEFTVDDIYDIHCNEINAGLIKKMAEQLI